MPRRYWDCPPVPSWKERSVRFGARITADTPPMGVYFAISEGLRKYCVTQVPGRWFSGNYTWVTVLRDGKLRFDAQSILGRDQESSGRKMRRFFVHHPDFDWDKPPEARQPDPDLNRVQKFF